eukprot:CAMPEP_0169149628 /NCGR_PEP_ID=MMETSP1015-20121227/49654_1 /TAXON_ID=342587 /ORGANISM="Karlodinium micrum, Strain CCMP2283" /LENGTH=53 /DNA_ID=CAMNT_0009218513 /DNA_START=328 /DNA_END=489 /DNA_ORIENTATION=+
MTISLFPTSQALVRTFPLIQHAFSNVLVVSIILLSEPRNSVKASTGARTPKSV